MSFQIATTAAPARNIGQLLVCGAATYGVPGRKVTSRSNGALTPASRSSTERHLSRRGPDERRAVGKAASKPPSMVHFDWPVGLLSERFVSSASTRHSHASSQAALLTK